MDQRKRYPILFVLALCLAPVTVADDGATVGWAAHNLWESILETIGFGDSIEQPQDTIGDLVNLDLSGSKIAPAGGPSPAGPGEPPADPEMYPLPDPSG
jgi:hypothetical protein